MKELLFAVISKLTVINPDLLVSLFLTISYLLKQNIFELLY